MKLRTMGIMLGVLLFSIPLNGIKKIAVRMQKVLCVLKRKHYNTNKNDPRPYDLSDKDFIEHIKKDKKQELWKSDQWGYNCLVRKLVKFHAHCDNDLLRKHIMAILEYDEGNLALLVWCKDDIKHAYRLIGLLGIKKLHDDLLHTVNKDLLRQYYEAAYERWEVPLPFESDFEPNEREHEEGDGELV